MRLASVALAVLLALAQDKQDDGGKKAARIDRALGWLLDEDSELREMGRKEIVAIGPDAIPAIERQIAKKGAGDLLQVLRRIDRKPAVADTWVAEDELKELEADEQFRKEAEKLPRDVAEKYLYVKYQEALAHVRRKNYQRAFDMANGLIALDSRSTHLEAFKRLRRHCENMITQTTLIEAKLTQPKLWYVEGETVELSARMKNLWKAAMTLNWEKGTEKEPGGGILLLDVEVTRSELGGASVSDQRHQELHFEEEIPIASGAQWEHKFTLDTTTAIEDGKEIRTIKIGGWTQPAKVSTDGVNITRRIQFEPAMVKIIPKKYARFMDNPLEWLGKMIDEGDPQEIYVCSQLLGDAEKDRGAEMLVKLLARSNTIISKNMAANLLTALTGQNFGLDYKRWENWYNNKNADAGKDKKKK